MIKGTVVKSTGSWYQVRLDDGTLKDCRIVGKFRLKGFQLTNPVAVGDEVGIVVEKENESVIKKIFDRKNYVARQSPHNKHQVHLLASNIDQAMVFATIVEPTIKPGFIDRFLMMTEPYNISTCIVFNKADLYDQGDMAVFEYLKKVYTDIGYDVLLVSALTGIGMSEFEMYLKDKITLVAGQSGVGKSSAVNALQPQLELKTGDISDYSGKGQHTTTFAEMHPLSFGGQLIDSPGIKTLAINYLKPQEIAHNFREFFILSKNCRYRGSCMHRNEPQCAVKEAVDAETISAIRYQNYLQILEETEAQNHWERVK